MRVLEIWRYLIKSVGAERLEVAPVVTIETGDELRTSGDLSGWLDRPVTLAAAAGPTRALDVLRTINAERATFLSVGALVA